MEVIESEEKGIWILKVQGVMDAHTSPSLKTKLETGIASGKTKLVVNMEGVSYLSSAGAGALLAGLTAARKKTGELRICSFQSGVKDAFEVMGFAKAFKVFPSLEEALKGF
ncbi:MAG: STAS domain-containing protein [Leptospiraceae bacterium]|nr:STAS domain-containing protein [Leptospiraceae bacterium]